MYDTRYIARLVLPTYQCRLRFCGVLDDEQEQEPHAVPLWMFALALVMLALLLGLSSALVFAPGGCR